MDLLIFLIVAIVLIPLFFKVVGKVFKWIIIAIVLYFLYTNFIAIG
ncbi:MAG: hypothetical protein RR588_06795 [Solibacillus sp.]